MRDPGWDLRGGRVEQGPGLCEVRHFFLNRPSGRLLFVTSETTSGRMVEHLDVCGRWEVSVPGGGEGVGQVSGRRCDRWVGLRLGEGEWHV